MPQNFSLAISEITGIEEHMTREVARLQGKQEILSKQAAQCEQVIEKIKTDREDFKKCIELVLKAGEAVKCDIRAGFERIVTHALQSIVGGAYKFVISFDKRGNLQEVDMNIVTEDLSEPFNPIDSRGGGIVDIVSIALRVSILELCTPKVEGPLIMDEPFKHLSEEYVPSAGRFMKSLVERLGRQVIFVTHNRQLINDADKVIEI